MNKKVISAAIVAVFVLSALATVIPVDDVEADDSEYWEAVPLPIIQPRDSYDISVPGHLVWIQEQVQARNLGAGDTFKLVNDIDLSAKNIQSPIGYGSVQFVSEFDGNGHSIIGLSLEYNAPYVGLFGYLGGGGNIHDLILEDPNISSNKNYVGGIVGFIGVTAIVTDCAVIGGSVSGQSDVGGIVGHNAGSVTNCYNTSTVRGSSNNIGGIVGNTYSNSDVSYCFNAGPVFGEANVGGIVGLNFNLGGVIYCYNSGTITGTDPNIGPVSGVVGNNNDGGIIEYVYNIGTINASDRARETDVCGQNINGGTVRNAYSLATVENNKGGRTAAQMTGTTAFTKMTGFNDREWTLKANDGSTLYAPQLKKFAVSPATAETIAISVESVKMTSGGSEGGSQGGSGGSGGSGGDDPDDGGDNTMLYIGIAAVAVVAVIGLLWFFVLKP